MSAIYLGKNACSPRIALKNPKKSHISSEQTVYRFTEKIGLSHKLKCKPNGITKTDCESRKSDDVLKSNFKEF